MEKNNNFQQLLTALFDYQEIEENPQLKKLIDKSQIYSRELSDDELDFVNAAGEIDNGKKPNSEEKPL